MGASDGPQGREALIRPRVLLVSPAFFGYERVIARTLVDLGFEVEYVDERASNHWMARALYRTWPALLAPWTVRHFSRVARRLRGRRLDVVLVIKGETVPESFVRRISQEHPTARFVYYSFDALRKTDNFNRIRGYFHHAYSFDRSDVGRVSRLQYKPLFYGPAFVPGPSHDDRTTALAYVGSVNPSRYAIVSALAERVDGASVFLYAPAQRYLAVRRLIDPKYRGVDPRRVDYRHLTLDDVARRFRDARVVLDMQKPGQSGLTMRTFEALASGAALVTTNARIMEEDFYTPERIAVVEDGDIDGTVAAVRRLLDHPLDGGMPPSFDVYSVRSWVAGFLELAGAPIETTESGLDATTGTDARAGEVGRSGEDRR